MSFKSHSGELQNIETDGVQSSIQWHSSLSPSVQACSIPLIILDQPSYWVLGYVEADWDFSRFKFLSPTRVRSPFILIVSFSPLVSLWFLSCRSMCAVSVGQGSDLVSFLRTFLIRLWSSFQCRLIVKVSSCLLDPGFRGDPACLSKPSILILEAWFAHAGAAGRCAL